MSDLCFEYVDVLRDGLLQVVEFDFLRFRVGIVLSVGGGLSLH